MHFQAPRLTIRAFPSYRFVPGTGQPHPIVDPRGHSYVPPAERRPRRVEIEPEAWDRCEDWLFGCDLYNHGYWWEAHEAWEGIWRSFERGSPLERFFRGLIQAAACHLKVAVGQEQGATGLGGNSVNLLRGASAGVGRPRLCGLDVPDFVARFVPYVERSLRRRPIAHDPLLFPYVRLAGERQGGAGTSPQS